MKSCPASKAPIECRRVYKPQKQGHKITVTLGDAHYKLLQSYCKEYEMSESYAAGRMIGTCLPLIKRKR